MAYSNMQSIRMTTCTVVHLIHFTIQASIDIAIERGLDIYTLVSRETPAPIDIWIRAEFLHDRGIICRPDKHQRWGRRPRGRGRLRAKPQATRNALKENLVKLLWRSNIQHIKLCTLSLYLKPS